MDQTEMDRLDMVAVRAAREVDAGEEPIAFEISRPALRQLRRLDSQARSRVRTRTRQPRGEQLLA